MEAHMIADILAAIMEECLTTCMMMAWAVMVILMAEVVMQDAILWEDIQAREGHTIMTTPEIPKKSCRGL